MISPTRSGWCKARSAMQKKLTLASQRSSRSRTAGVTDWSGPSSRVMAISPRALASAGKQRQLGPSQSLHGNNPAKVNSAWSAAMAPKPQGQASGFKAIAVIAPTCKSADAWMKGLGCQRGSDKVFMSMQNRPIIRKKRAREWPQDPRSRQSHEARKPGKRPTGQSLPPWRYWRIAAMPGY